MSSEKTIKASRKEPRQLKELRSLLPWGWDSRALAHPPGKKTLRDFQECRKFLDPATVDGQGSIASSTAYRKRQRKEGKENAMGGQKTLTSSLTVQLQKPEADSKLAASKEVLKTPLVQPKPLKQDDSAFNSLSDNTCTGVTLVTPMDQQLAMQRGAVNTMGSNVSTGLALTPGLQTTPIIEEAPRTAGRSESPAVPKKLLSGGSPEFSDVALMDARADEQQPADCPHPKGNKDDAADVVARNSETESCKSDVSAQLLCQRHQSHDEEMSSGWKSLERAVREPSPHVGTQAELMETKAQPTASADKQRRPAALPQPQPHHCASSLRLRSVSPAEAPAVPTVLPIPDLDTAGTAPVCLQSASRPALPRTCPPLFHTPTEGTPNSHVVPRTSQKRSVRTPQRAAHSRPLTQAIASTCTGSWAAQATPPAFDVRAAPYEEALGGLWRETWAWEKPLPQFPSGMCTRAPGHQSRKLEVSFLEGCRNLMRLQCDSSKSWPGLQGRT